MMTDEIGVSSWLVMLHLCWRLAVTGADVVREGQIVGTADGRSCPPLQPLEHGEYICSEEGQSFVCKLSCQEGYVVPVTEYSGGEHIPLAQRATYKCAPFPGGFAWEPNIFFDCIEKKPPANYVFYFPITVYPRYPCTDKSDVQKMQSTSVHTLRQTNVYNLCQRDMNGVCDWNTAVLCQRGKWLVDAFFRIKFHKYAQENYQEWKELTVKSVMNRVGPGEGFGVTPNVSTVDQPLYYIECPRASKLEPDYTCRGCSKGYFMDESLMECQPCPQGHYQDETYQFRCKVCPGEVSRPEIALRDALSCFHSEHWAKKTSFYTFLLCLACIVLLTSALLAFRSTVRNEPDGIKKEVYIPDRPPDRTTGGYLQRFAYFASLSIKQRRKSSQPIVVATISGAGDSVSVTYDDNQPTAASQGHPTILVTHASQILLESESRTAMRDNKIHFLLPGASTAVEEPEAEVPRKMSTSGPKTKKPHPTALRKASFEAAIVRSRLSLRHNRSTLSFYRHSGVVHAPSGERVRNIPPDPVTLTEPEAQTSAVSMQSSEGRARMT